MAIRSNTIVFTFDPARPRNTAHDIYEWLHAEIRIQGQKVQVIQTYGIKRQVYVKLTDKDYMSSTAQGGVQTLYRGIIPRGGTGSGNGL
jgi:hypothetical protein